MSVLLRPLKETDLEHTIALFHSVLDELHSDNLPARESYRKLDDFWFHLNVYHMTKRL